MAYTLSRRRMLRGMAAGVPIAVALPRLDAASVKWLFARPQPVASPEGSGRPVQQEPAPLLERWFTLDQGEIFQTV